MAAGWCWQCLVAHWLTIDEPMTHLHTITKRDLIFRINYTEISARRIDGEREREERENKGESSDKRNRLITTWDGKEKGRRKRFDISNADPSIRNFQYSVLQKWNRCRKGGERKDTSITSSRYIWDNWLGKLWQTLFFFRQSSWFCLSKEEKSGDVSIREKSAAVKKLSTPVPLFPFCYLVPSVV